MNFFFSTFQENLVDFDSLIESLYEYPEIGKKSHTGGKDESNNDDIEDYDSALRHLIDDFFPNLIFPPKIGNKNKNSYFLVYDFAIFWIMNQDW